MIDTNQSYDPKLQPNGKPNIQNDTGGGGSKFYDIYKEKMKKYTDSIEIAKQQCQRQFVKSSVKKLKQHQFSHTLQLKVIYNSINKEVVILNAKWGYFQTEIYILNVMGQSRTHHLNGKYSIENRSLHILNTQQGPFMMKCIKMADDLSRQYAIKEWFLLKIASLLKVGPAMKQYIGFDLVMHQECTQFAMEFCQQLHKQNLDRASLLINVGLMHQYNILHQDIKPENVMFSPFYNKPVLIDFGLSRIINEKLGQLTMTSFVGSLNFCSEQMTECFNYDKILPLDLYYNDVYSMMQSIDVLKRFAPNDDEYSQSSQKSQKLAEYLVNLFLSKFALLDRSKQVNFQVLSKVHQLKQTAQILAFLKQFNPNPVTCYFFRHVPETETQSMLYNELKYVYQCDNQYNSCLTFETNQSKIDLFSSFYSDLHQQLDLKVTTKNRIKTIKQLVTNKQLIRKTPYLKYATLYLQYISYLDNKCGTTAQQRVNVAKLYIQIFISSQISEQLNGRAIVSMTIIHLLNECLKQTRQYTESNSLSSLLFNLYDFLTVLDCGSSEEYLTWVSDIYSHSAIKKKDKLQFLQKVLLSLYLHKKRITQKKDQPRFHMINKLECWTNEQQDTESLKILTIKEKTEIGLFSPRYFHLEQSQLHVEKNKVMQMQELEVKQIQQVHRKFLQCKQNHGYQKFGYQLMIAYNSYFCCFNPYFCSRIYSIFSKNVNDPELLQQFSFHFQINKLMPKLIDTKTCFFAKTLKVADQYFTLMENQSENETFYVAKCLFNRLISKNQQKYESLDQNLRQYVSDRYKSKIAAFCDQMVRDLTEQNKFKHHCVKAKAILDCCVMAKVIIPEKGDAFLQQLVTISKQKQTGNCQKCHFLLKIDLNLYFMKNCLFRQIARTKLSPEILQMDNTSILQKLDEILQLTNSKFSKAILSPSQSMMIQAIALNFLQLMSFISNNQQKYHGIQRFFEFCSKNNCFIHYVRNEYYKNFTLQNLLQVLLQKCPTKYVEFLFRITEILEDKQNRAFCSKINRSYNNHVNKSIRSQQQVCEIIDLMQRFQRNSAKKYPYIVVIYNILLNTVENTIKYRLLYQILRIVQSVSFYTRRITRANLYLCKLKLLQGQPNSRCQIYVTKNLIKVMMYLFDNSKRKSRQSKAACIKKRMLQNKLSNLNQAQILGFHLKLRACQRKHKTL